MAMTADDVVTKYVVEIWNEGNAELIREICADPVTRHEAKEVTWLTHDEQVARVIAVHKKALPVFENVIQASDGTYVTAVYKVTMNLPGPEGSEDSRVKKFGCGIEVFKVVDGRISEVWNHPMMDGSWA